MLTTKQKRKKFLLRKILSLLVVLLIVSYVAYQIFSGNRGLLTMFELTKKKQKLEEKIIALEKQKETIESKVERLKPESLDIDLLDEQARSVLGYGQKNETVIIEEE
jgi:cell division protein FtsB